MQYMVDKGLVARTYKNFYSEGKKKRRKMGRRWGQAVDSDGSSKSQQTHFRCLPFPLSRKRP